VGRASNKQILKVKDEGLLAALLDVELSRKQPRKQILLPRPQQV